MKPLVIFATSILLALCTLIMFEPVVIHTIELYPIGITVALSWVGITWFLF